MKLFVIGATGRTGKEIAQQALARGHQVTAFVRSPESIASRNERLVVLKGDVMDENQLFSAMRNHDAVLSALGPRQVFKASLMLRDSAHATTQASRWSETVACAFGRRAFSWSSQSDRQLHHAKPHAGFACHGRNRARQWSRLDDRPSSPSHGGRFLSLPQPRGRRAPDGVHSRSQSGCGIHARCDRASETFSQNRWYREIESTEFSMFSPA
jgi:NAD(P)H-binding